MAQMRLSAMLTMKADGTREIKQDTQAIANNLSSAQQSADKLSRKRGSVRDRAEDKGLDPRSHRAHRGAAGLRGAAGRDFAGLAQAGGETTGIVAAYATLAANIFALTAAFKALSDAAKAVQLQKGLEQLGATSGRTLSIVAKNMQEMSGYALSTVEAMKSVASATAAGFSSKEIERITRVAKGASTALGRDLSDSMDRLTRGTIKLEPELLDELGIMTRLNDATKVYALQNNKAVSALTQTERRQAFLNAVLAEGEQKFGDIADNVPVSTYDKLAATIKDFGTARLSEVNSLINGLLDTLIAFPALGLVPLAAMFSSIFGKLIGTVDGYAKKSKDRLTDHTNEVKRATEQYEKYAKKVSTVQTSYTPEQKMAAGTIAARAGIRFAAGDQNTLAVLKNMENTLKGSLTKATEHLNNARERGNKAAIAGIEKQIALKEVLLSKIREEAAGAAGMGRLSPERRFGATGRLKESLAQNAAKFETDIFESRGTLFGPLKESFKAVGRDIGTTFKAIKVEGENTAKALATQYGRTVPSIGDKFIAVGTSAKVAFVGFTTAASTALQGLQAALGPIFLILTAITLAFSAWGFIEETFLGVTKEVKKARDNMDAVYKTSKKLADEILKFQAMNQFGKAIDASVTSMVELKTAFDEVKKARQEAGSIFGNKEGKINIAKGMTEAAGRMAKSQGATEEEAKYIEGISIAMMAQGPKVFEEYSKKMKAALLEGKDAALKFADDTVNAFSKAANAFADMTDEARSLDDQLKKIKTPDLFETPYAKVAEGFQSIQNSFKSVTDANKAMGYSNEQNLSAYGQLIASNSILATEIGIVTNKQEEVRGIQKEITRLSAQRLAVEQNQTLTEEKKKGLIGAYNTLLNTQYTKIAEIADENANIALSVKAYDAVLAEANLKLAKLKQTQLELVAASMKHTSSMAKISRDMGTMSRLGSTDMGPQALAAEEVIAAKEALDIAKKTADIKKEVIRLEADLLKKQSEVQILQMQDTLLSQFDQTQIDSMESLITNALQKRGEERKKELEDTRQLHPLLFTRLMIQRRLVEMGQMAVGTTRLQIQAIDDSVIAAQKQLDLAIAKAGLDGHELNIKKSVADQEAKILSIRKEIFSVESRISQKRLELQKMQLEGTAFAQGREVTPQETYTLEKAGLQLAYDNAVKEKEFLLEEHAAKLEAIKFEGQINDLKLQEAILRYEAALKDPNLDPRLKTQYENLITQTQGLRATSTLNQLSMTRYTRKLQQRQITEADLNIDTAAQALANAVDPLTKALGDLTIDRNKAIKQAGLGANFFTSMMSPEVANLQNEYASKYGDIFNADEVQKMAVEQALFNEQLDMGNKLAQSIGQSFSTAFQGLIQGTITAEQAFKQMGISMLQTLAEIYMRMLAIQLISMFTPGIPQLPMGDTGTLGLIQPITDLPTFVVGAAGGIMPMASGGIMDKQYTPMATGGVMSRSTPVQGIITKPTYLVGEGKYNEAVVPLPNGREIPVQMHGSSGSNNVNVNVNIASNGDTQVSGNDGQNLGAAVARAVQKELLAQKAPGGILNKYGVS